MVAVLVAVSLPGAYSSAHDLRVFLRAAQARNTLVVSTPPRGHRIGVAVLGSPGGHTTSETRALHAVSGREPRSAAGGRPVAGRGFPAGPGRRRPLARVPGHPLRVTSRGPGRSSVQSRAGERNDVLVRE